MCYICHIVIYLKDSEKLLVAQSCLTLFNSRLLCPWNSPGKNTGVDLPVPSPGDLPNPGIEAGSPALQEDSLASEPEGR